MREKRLLIMIGLLLSVDAYSSFITDDEYAQMLYKNPRGIGCDKCHGAHGAGMILSTYTDKHGHVINIKAPRINNLTMKRFRKSFEKKSKLMPKYFLTSDEKAHLYYYLTKNEKKERRDNVNRKK